MVDHSGRTDTREFQDVKEVGRLLEQLEAVGGTGVPAQAALIYDWENLWAMEDAQGPRNLGVHYKEQVKAHYKALWELGIPMDVVDETGDISGYKLVIAPMLYLLREGFAEKLRAFVEQGGRPGGHLPHGDRERE